MDTGRENTRTALGYMTAIMAEPDDTSFGMRQLTAILNEKGHPREGALDMIVGLTNLCSYLMISCEKEHGRGAAEQLQVVARELF